MAKPRIMIIMMGGKRFGMRLLPVFILVALGILMLGCAGQETEQQDIGPGHEIVEEEPIVEEAEQPLVKETAFANFTDGDFSMEYPEWDVREAANTSILAIGNAWCVLNVDRHDASITPLFNWVINATAANENISLDEVDLENYSMGFAADFNNITFNATTKMVYCNHETYVILATCAEDYYHEYEEELERFSSSASCAVEYEEPDYSQAPVLPDLDDTEFSTFIDEDYSAKIPEWDEGTVENETIVRLSKGACTMVLNKYNVLSDTLYDWAERYIEENDSLEPIRMDPEENRIEYEMKAGNVTLRIDSAITYCNYQSYDMITICEKGYFEENEDTLKVIGGSPRCARTYTIAPEITEVEETKEIPEEDRVVETDVGEEYGINAEAVVSFFNGNPIFVKVMKNYDKVNLRITADDEDINLKARLEDGYIVKVREGSYSDAEFTVIMPLEDALNIFSNADNISIGNILSFIVNVETDPPEKKNELVKEAFKAG